VSARVGGARYEGGVDVTVECPRLIDGEPCEAEHDAYVTDGGSFVLKATACAFCKVEWTEAEREVMKQAALDAVDNYDGPGDEYYAAQFDAVSVEERRELDVRNYIRNR
jgi:hypothetical protein